MFSRSLLILLGVAAVSWGGPLVRLATEAPPLVIAFWRTAIAAMVLIPLAVIRHRSELRTLGKRRLLALGASGAFLALHFASWIASIDFTTIAASVLLVSSTPVWVALAAVIVLGERLRSRGWWGIALAVAGGTLVGLSGTTTSEPSMGLGNLLALGGAVAAAGYLMMGRSVRPTTSLLTYVAGVYGIAALLLLVSLVAARQSPFGYGAETWLAMLAIAFGPQLIGHTTFNFLLAELEAWKVAVAVLGEPIGSALIALLLFAEVPGILVLPGGVLLLAGIALAMTSEVGVGPVAPGG